MTPKQTEAVQKALDALTILGDAQDKEVRPEIWHKAKGREVIEAPQEIKGEAAAEQPAQPQPVRQQSDEHQAFIDSLPSGSDDKMFEQIHHWARQSYQRHKMSVRGQQITAADAADSHIIWAALRWAKENAAQPVRQPLTDEQIAEACGWQAEMGCKPLPRELRIARAIEAAHGITKGGAT